MGSYEETNKKRNVLWNLIKKAMGRKKTMECVLLKKLIRKEKFGNFVRNRGNGNNTETGQYI